MTVLRGGADWLAGHGGRSGRHCSSYKVQVHRLMADVVVWLPSSVFVLAMDLCIHAQSL